MIRRRSAGLLLAAIGYGAIHSPCVAQVPVRPPPVVRQIDHILIASSEAKELFTLLSGTLQLPVAWPFSDYGSFASGGVTLGNVNLEIILDSRAATRGSKSRWAGFALEPEPLRTSLTELDARRIPHGVPMPFTSRQPDGSLTTLWTTVGLPTVSSDTGEVFFCEYAHDVPARRLLSLRQLQSRAGGPLSVQSVREIVLGARDVARTRERWQALLYPLEAVSPGVWPLGAGPAIRVVQADRDGIQGLVIDVESLQQARRYLEEQGLLGSDVPAALTLAGSQLQGLSVMLVEQR